MNIRALLNNGGSKEPVNLRDIISDQPTQVFNKEDVVELP